MKSNKNPQLKTQIEIVKTLLDGSYKSQRQIADDICRTESTVSKALFYLKDVVISEEKVIESGRYNKGLYKNRLCHLSFEIDNGIHILEFFKDILTQETISKQEEKQILEVLREKMADDFILNMLLVKTKMIDPNIKPQDLQKTKEIFRKMLKISPTFIKRLIDDSFINYKNIWLKLNGEKLLSNNAIDVIVLIDMFKTSIICDVLSGDINLDSIEPDDEISAMAAMNGFFAVIAGIIEGLKEGFNKATSEIENISPRAQIPPEIEAKIRQEVKEKSTRMEWENWKEKLWRNALT